MDNKLINRRHFMKSSVAGMAGFICLPSTNKRQGKNQKERKLIYRTLGKTGIRVPVIGMGILSSGSPALMRAALDAVLAGQPVSEAQTPSLGCNIKWQAGNEPEYFPA